MRDQDRDLRGRQRGQVARFYRPDLGGREAGNLVGVQGLDLIARQGLDLGGGQG